MDDLLAKFDAEHFIGLVAVVGGLLIGLLCGLSGIIVGCWQLVRRAEITASLKRDMLSRGMSAEEIRVVIEAGSEFAGKPGHKHQCGK